MLMGHGVTVPFDVRRRAPAWVRELVLLAAGSALLAVSAQIVVWLPLSPVPVTGQTLAVLLIGALYGSRRGTACVGAYLVEGACGLPVFAGGSSGLLYLLGPTGGYLVGFLGAAWIVGVLAERGWDRRLGPALAAMALGTAMIFVCGLIWLALYVGPGRVLAQGLVPFLPGAAIKIALAAVLVPIGRKMIG